MPGCKPNHLYKYDFLFNCTTVVYAKFDSLIEINSLREVNTVSKDECRILHRTGRDVPNICVQQNIRVLIWEQYFTARNIIQ